MKTIDVKISDNIDFFGKIKELVIKIDDANQELKDLRQKIKETLLNLNEEYKKSYNKDLYDITFSEQYPFVPHITFGHISSQVNKVLEENGIDSTEIVEKIRERIKNELPKLLNLNNEERQLIINSFQINSSDRKVLKKFNLKN